MVNIYYSNFTSLVQFQTIYCELTVLAVSGHFGRGHYGPGHFGRGHFYLYFRH